MRTENQVTIGMQMVGVVLHKGGAPWQVGGHRFHRPNQGTGFPIALSAKAVAFRHQTLDRQPRQLLEPVQNLEVRGKALEIARLEKSAKAYLNSCAVTKRIVTRPALAQFRRDRVALLVLRAEARDRFIGYFIDILDEIADAVTVNRKAELRLGGNLVSFGDRDLAHVVVKADKS